MKAPQYKAADDKCKKRVSSRAKLALRRETTCLAVGGTEGSCGRWFSVGSLSKVELMGKHNTCSAKGKQVSLGGE